MKKLAKYLEKLAMYLEKVVKYLEKTKDLSERNLSEIGLRMTSVREIPQNPKNLLEEILCDADLDYLGREDFFKIGNHLFEELKSYKIVNTEREWDLLQIRFLEQHQYFTKTAIAIRKPKKDLYLKLLKDKKEYNE